jgi:anti-sigma-K factor RskA
MSNLLGQLENNEAILLMYLAGELPAEERAEVEQMLANDAGLRTLLAALTALQSDVDGVLAKADSTMLLPRREAAVRRVSRAVAAAQAKPVEAGAPADDHAAARFRVPWWAYPIAAVAAVIVGMVLVTDRTGVNLPPKTPMAGLGEEGSNAVAYAPRILEIQQDPAIDRIERAEREFLNPEPDLFTFDTSDFDR